MPDYFFRGNTPRHCGNAPRRVPTATIALILTLFFCFSARTQPKTIYADAVTDMNFTTIQYVLAADTGKKEAVALAAKLPELNGNWEQLIEEIRRVYNTNSRTEDLSRKIQEYANKYSTAKPFADQLQAVSQFITDNRKGKPYLDALTKDLTRIQADALVAAGNAVAATGSPADPSVELVKTSAAQGGEAVTPPNAGVPIWLTLLVLLALALSAANLWLYWKLQKRRSRSGSSGDLHTTIRSIVDVEVYQPFERKLDAYEKQVAQLKKELEALRADKHVPEPVPVAATTPVHPVMAPATEARPVAPPNNPAVEPGNTVEFPVRKANTEKPVPARKYADYPKENGFVISQLYDTTDRRTIYELSIPPEGEQASFTIVNDQAIHEYAIQNRDKLLKDACDFEVSSSRHSRIEVVRPGRLHKDGNAWIIYAKAQIKFV